MNRLIIRLYNGFLEQLIYFAVFLSLFIIFGHVVNGQTQTFTTSGVFTVPAGVTSITVECWGAGGGGSTITASGARGGGGGGGAYASSILTVTPGNSYNIVIGSGGAANTNGGNTTFNSTSVIAAGGRGGTNNSATAGAGGTVANSTGSIKYAGGNGANGGSTYSGGGGGGAGSNGAGGNVSGSTAGVGTTMSGGTGGAGRSGSNNGYTGSVYGSGGGGAVTNSSTDRYGGSGLNGFVLISWNVPVTGTIIGSPFCAGNSVSVPFTTNGTFSSGNVFTAQLSNSSGSFVSPTTLGTLTSTTSGTISGTIPVNTSNGAAYRVRVVSSNPVITGIDNGTNLVIYEIPIITATIPGLNCGSGTVVIGATVSTGTINWYSSSSGGSSLGTGATYTTQSLSASTNYYIDAANNGCISSPRTSVLASIIPQANITSGGGGTFCNNSHITLTSSGTNIDNQYWIGPNNFYSLDQNINFVNATSVIDGDYIVTGSSLSGINMVVNGDFEDGKIGFGSSYSASTDLTVEGRYAVVSNPNTVHPDFIDCVNHTPSGTLQLVVNAAVIAGDTVWSQSVSVKQHSYYQFSYWVQSVVATNPSVMQLYVNSVPLGIEYTALTQTCQWIKFIYNWYSGSDTKAYLSMVNQNTIAFGNDFAMDDIVFQEVCPESTTENISVNAVVTEGSISSSQTICCGSAPAILTSLVNGTGSGIISYEWQSNASGSFITISGANTSTYSPPILTTTTSYKRRTVSLSGGINCYSDYTTPVVITVIATVVAGVSDTACQSLSPSAITLNGASFGGGASTAAWSIFSGGGLLSSTLQTSSPATITYTPASNYSGIVTLRLTTNVVSGCSGISDRTILILPTTTAVSGNNIYTCSNSGAVNITAGSSATNYSSIVWTSNGTGNFNNPNSLTTAIYTPSAADIATGSVTLTLTVTGNPPCSNSVSSKTLTITPLPVATFSYVDNPYCSNASNPSPTYNGGGVAGTFSSATGLVFISTSSGQVNLSASISGTYSVINSIVASNGCSQVTDSNYITINPILPVNISITPSFNPSCLDSSVTFTATPTNGGTTPVYQWKVNTISVGSNSSAYNYIPANNDDILCILTSNASPCATGNPSSSNTINMNVIPCINKWKGTISNVWNLAGNWTQNIVPVTDANIIFDDIPLNHCQLDQNRSITDLTNSQSTYRMVLNGFKLSVKGNINFTNGAQIDASSNNSIIEFSGLSQQSVLTASFYNNEVYNILINNPNNVILNGSLRLLNTLTSNSGSLDAFTNSPTVIYAGSVSQNINNNLYLNNTIYNLIVDNANGVFQNTNFTVSDSLLINSGKIFSISSVNQLNAIGVMINNSNSTGLVLQSDASGTASLIHNSNNVPATVKRYITGNPEAWHFLSSPVTAQSISGNWLPSGSYGNGTGYDLYVWHEPTSCWIYKLDLASAINWNTVHPGSQFVAGRAYLYSLQEANPTKEFAGNLNNSIVNYGITANSINSNLKGFNLIGNPYPSSIDWQASSGWSRNNLIINGGGYDMWIWNETAGNYGVCNSSSGSVGTNNVTRYIAPMQGFFVQASTTSGSISMDNQVRVHNEASNWFKNYKNNQKYLGAIVQSESDNCYDEARLVFADSNQHGATKLFSHKSTAPSLYFYSGNNYLSVRCLLDTIDNPMVPMMFKPGKDGNYIFNFEFENESFEIAMLEDCKTHYIQNLKLKNTYRFKSSVNDDIQRFKLHFGNDINAHYNELPVRIYSDGICLNIDLTLIAKETEILVYDPIGRLLLQKTLVGLKEHKLLINADSQLLIVKLINPQGNKCQKILFN